jgi:predicted aspartyl protease
MGTIAAALALVIASSGTPPPEAAQPGLVLPDVLATSADHVQRMTLPVSIGSRGPYRFLIDTAAQHTVVSAGLAGRLALPASGPATVLGIAGSRQVETVAVDDIRFGRVTYDGVGAPILADADLDADGIIGLDGLAGRRVLFDFAAGRIALFPQSPSKSASDEIGGHFEIVVTARRRDNQLIMTNATINGVRTDVVIDTGSDVSIGNRALQHALSRHRTGEPTTLRSVTGQEIAADFADAGAFEIGPARISNIGVAFTDAPTFKTLRLDRHPALLLGMRDLKLFRRVVIDFANRKVLFDVP